MIPVINQGKCTYIVVLVEGNSKRLSW